MRPDWQTVLRSAGSDAERSATHRGFRSSPSRFWLSALKALALTPAHRDSFHRRRHLPHALLSKPPHRLASAASPRSDGDISQLRPPWPPHGARTSTRRLAPSPAPAIARCGRCFPSQLCKRRRRHSISPTGPLSSFAVVAFSEGTDRATSPITGCDTSAALTGEPKRLTAVFVHLFDDFGSISVADAAWFRPLAPILLRRPTMGRTKGTPECSTPPAQTKTS